VLFIKASEKKSRYSVIPARTHAHNQHQILQVLDRKPRIDCVSSC